MLIDSFCSQGRGTWAHSQVERVVQIFVQNERQRVDRGAGSLHTADIRQKGELNHFFCLFFQKKFLEWRKSVTHW